MWWIITLAKMLRFPSSIRKCAFCEFLSAICIRFEPFFLRQAILWLLFLRILGINTIWGFDVNQFERVLKQLLLDFFVHWTVSVEAWSVIDLYHPRFEPSIKHNIEAKNFEARRLLWMMREAWSVIMLKRVLCWKQRFNDNIVNLSPDFFNVVAIISKNRWVLKLWSLTSPEPLIYRRKSSFVTFAVIDNKIFRLLVDRVISQVHHAVKNSFLILTVTNW